jgi:hypothetical protein
MHASRTRNDNFGSTLVQRLNAGERNSPSPAQVLSVGGFLAGLGKHDNKAEHGTRQKELRFRQRAILVRFLEFGLMNQGGARILRLLSFIHLWLRMYESMNSHPHARHGTTS